MLFSPLLTQNSPSIQFSLSSVHTCSPCHFFLCWSLACPFGLAYILFPASGLLLDCQHFGNPLTVLQAPLPISLSFFLYLSQFALVQSIRHSILQLHLEFALFVWWSYQLPWSEAFFLLWVRLLECQICFFSLQCRQLFSAVNTKKKRSKIKINHRNVKLLTFIIFWLHLWVFFSFDTNSNIIYINIST